MDVNFAQWDRKGNRCRFVAVLDEITLTGRFRNSRWSGFICTYEGQGWSAELKDTVRAAAWERYRKEIDKG